MQKYFKLFIALSSGTLFGLGLMISQMVDPAKVISFLDVFGDWDPSMALVMIGALIVFGSGFWLLLKNKTHSFFGKAINICQSSELTPKLYIGSAIFGIGWGITGICPGPAIANVSSGDIKIYVFILVMILGMKTSEWVKKRV
ncbi:MAG: YeeE/YedE family protein [Kangiella sp.]|nr:MAG: YeeE/YedE family protein [Kangiella sp.]